MSTIQTFRDLNVWQLAMQLAVDVYGVTGSFPPDERFGLTNQVRRSTSSVSSNIAEGYGRGSRVDYVRFLKIARGSLYEADTQLELARELGFLDAAEYEPVKRTMDNCERALAGLIRSLNASPQSP